MGILSLSEFRNRLNNDFANKTFVFSTTNQTWHNTKSTLGLELVFKNVVITLNPNTIFFSDKANNSLKLSRVRVVKEENPCPLGEVFTVICGGQGSLDDRVKYTFVVR